MEQSAFHELLKNLQTAVEQGQRQQLEETFYGFRNMNPSDSFVQLLLNEIITPSETQKFAQILLQKDIEKNGSKCSLHRLHDTTLGRNLMVQLMQYSTGSPSVFIGRTVGHFTLEEISHNREFPEALAFIQQALGSAEVRVKEMGMEALQVLCLNTALQNIRLPVLDILQETLGDQDVDVALCTVRTLQAVLEMNESAETPVVPEEAQKAILMACLQRTGQAIQIGQEEKAELMLQAVDEIIDQLSDVVKVLIPQIIAFAEQVIAADVIELLKFRAVQIVSGLCEIVADDRKQNLDHLVSFVRRQVIPNLGMKEEDIATWTQNAASFEYENTSLMAACEDMVEVAAAALGKQAIYPLILESFQIAANGTPTQILNALCLVEYTAEGLSDVLKQTEITQIVQKVIQFAQSPIPRVRYETAQTISIFSSDLKEKLQSQHQTLIQTLNKLTGDQEDHRTQAMAVTAICSIAEQMKPQVLTKQSQALYALAKKAFQGTMDAQTSAMMLLAALADGLDQDRIEPLLIDFMPGVFQSLEGVMQAMQSTDTFSNEQTDFINALLECLGIAIEAVPELFKQQLEPLMNCLQLIVKRTQAQQEEDIFTNALDMAKTLFSNFPDDAEQYVDAMVSILVDIIRAPAIFTDTRPETEGDLLADPNRDNMISAGLIALSDLIEDFPKHFSQSILALYKLMDDFVPIGPAQTIGRHEIYAQLIHIAQEAGQNIQELHAVIFPKIQSAILGTPADDGSYANRGDIPEYEMQQFSSMSDLLFVYLRSYLKYCAATGDLQTYGQTVEAIMQMLSQVHLFVETKFARMFEAIEAADYDADERTAEFEALVDGFDAAMDNIGQAYSQFFLVLKENLSDDLLARLLTVIDELLEKGVESDPAVISTIQGISLLADIASFCSKKTADPVLEKYIQGMVHIAQQKTEEWQLLQVIFFALQKFLTKTQNAAVASNAELLNLSVQLLDAAQEDGEEFAMNFYDNACNFLWVAGELTNQGPDFWKALCKYCAKMESDGECIADGVYFFVAELQKNATMQQIKSDVITVISKLFFGAYFSDIRNEESNAQILADLGALFSDPSARQIGQRVVQADELSRENFQKFLSK